MTPSPDPAIHPLTLYYDGSCPMCAAEIRNLRLRDRHGLLRFSDVSVPGYADGPAGVSPERLMQAMHARQADGTLVQSVAVFRLAYRAVGLDGVADAISLPLIAPLADALYPWVARWRQRMPRWLTYVLFERAARRAAARAQACAQGRCPL